MSDRRLFIVEQSALGPGGHYHTYTSALVAAAAGRAGPAPVVLANRRAPASLFRGAVVVPAFSFGWSQAPVSGRTDWSLGNFAFDLAEGLARRPPSPGDPVLIHTLGTGELLSLLRWLAQAEPGQPGPVFHLLLRYDPASLLPELVDLRALVAQARLALGSRLVFHADTAGLVGELSDLLDVGVELAPVVFSHRWPAFRPARPHGRNRPPRVAYLGDARIEKGFLELPGAIEAAWDPFVVRRRARFTVQCNFNQAGGEPGIAETVRRLGRFGRAVRRLPRPLSAKAYYGQLAAADIVLAPYDPAAYRLRSSGVLLEAAAAGKVVVATAGTWLADQLDPDAAVLLSRPAELGAALGRALADYPGLAAGARAAQARHLRASDPLRMIEHLEAAAERARHASPPSGPPRVPTRLGPLDRALEAIVAALLAGEPLPSGPVAVAAAADLDALRPAAEAAIARLMLDFTAEALADPQIRATVGRVNRHAAARAMSRVVESVVAATLDKSATPGAPLVYLASVPLVGEPAERPPSSGYRLSVPRDPDSPARQEIRFAPLDMSAPRGTGWSFDGVTGLPVLLPLEAARLRLPIPLVPGPAVAGLWSPDPDLDRLRRASDDAPLGAVRRIGAEYLLSVDLPRTALGGVAIDVRHTGRRPLPLSGLFGQLDGGGELPAPDTPGVELHRAALRLTEGVAPPPSTGDALRPLLEAGGEAGLLTRLERLRAEGMAGLDRPRREIEALTADMAALYGSALSRAVVSPLLGGPRGAGYRRWRRGRAPHAIDLPGLDPAQGVGRTGFYNLETDPEGVRFSWTGRLAPAVIEVPVAVQSLSAIEIGFYSLGRTELEALRFEVNGAPVAASPLPGSRPALRLTPIWPPSGPLHLAIHGEAHFTPEGDPRRLGVAVAGLRLRAR